MPTFALPTTQYVYRALRKGDSGWDVYALQTALNQFGALKLVEDGVFGDDTLEKLVRYQRNRDLLADGIAGVVSQRSLVLGVVQPLREKYGIPFDLPKGQIEHESGYLVGNHTPRYSDGSRDLGVIQINDLHKALAWDKTFSVPFALDFYCRTIRSTYDRYSAWDPKRAQRLADRSLPTPDFRRRWTLAGGSWNRPAHTAWFAGESMASSVKPTASQIEWIETYMNHVTRYVIWG